MKRINAMAGDTCNDDMVEQSIRDAVMHNPQPNHRQCEWIDLEDALKGPEHVANKLIREWQKRRSTPERQYTFTAEQLGCIALFVSRLEEAFEKRSVLGQPWIHPARVMMTIIMHG